MTDDVAHLPRPTIVAADNCGNCRFHLANDGGGVCRRFPPQCFVVGGQHIVGGSHQIITQSYFAPADPSMWCGEHDRKASTQKEFGSNLFVAADDCADDRAASSRESEQIV